MARLTNEHKLFIVQELACFRTPTEVVQAVKAEYEIEVDRRQVQFYDPTKRPENKKLPEKWKEIFWATRGKYLEDAAGVAVAHQRYRLEVLNEVLQRQRSKPNVNDVLVLSTLEQAAKERGGAFTNRRELTGKGGGPIETNAVTLEQWKELAAKQLAQVEETMAAFDGGNE
ncbi:MAG TPA: DUF2280 domain-containing protein [Pyrinomonadaceae bacterium]|jgi:hypothetical protein